MKIPTVRCNRCGKSRIPRTADPKKCSKCGSPYWNKPRKYKLKKRK